jgi:hypothetical protein
VIDNPNLAAGQGGSRQMKPPPHFRYVEHVLGKLGVKIRAEPGEYVVMRKGGPWRERRGLDELHDAFAYGLRLALLPAPYRSPYRWRPYILDTPQKRKHDRRACEIRKAQANLRRDEIARAEADATTRRAAHIRDELARLGVEPCPQKPQN